MSDCYVNVRFGLYHLKLTRDWRITFTRNEYHVGYPDGIFRVHEFFGCGEWPGRAARFGGDSE